MLGTALRSLQAIAAVPSTVYCTCANPAGHSGGSRAVGGLDDIFARMSPSTSGTGTGRIDDDEDDSRDGNLLGSAEDSLAGTHVSWQARRGGK